MAQEEMGIIKGIDFGMRDAGRPVLWFAVHTLGGGSLQVLDGPEALDFVRKADCHSITDLNGKPCIVETDGNLMTFKRMLDNWKEND